MDIYKAVTQQEVEAINAEIAQLEEAMASLETKQTLQRYVREPQATQKLKINYALREERFDYEKLKRIEEEKKTVRPKPKVGIDANWLAANMQEPNIRQFFDPTEMIRPHRDFSLSAETSEVRRDERQSEKVDTWREYVADYENSILESSVY